MIKRMCIFRRTKHEADNVPAQWHNRFLGDVSNENFFIHIKKNHAGNNNKKKRPNEGNMKERQAWKNGKRGTEDLITCDNFPQTSKTVEASCVELLPRQTFPLTLSDSLYIGINSSYNSLFSLFPHNCRNFYWHFFFQELHAKVIIKYITYPA